MSSHLAPDDCAPSRCSLPLSGRVLYRDNATGHVFAEELDAEWREAWQTAMAAALIPITRMRDRVLDLLLLR